MRDTPQSERLGDAPVEEAYREKMTNLARLIDRKLNGRSGRKLLGFVLMMFEFNEQGRCNYMSNANRADVVRLLEEQLARFKADTPPQAPQSYTAPKVRAVIDKLTTEFVDKGRLIEAGFEAMRLANVIPPDAPPVQVREMRKAFFAGAQHLFSSVFSFLKPGEEPTDKDLARLDQVANELAQFVNELEAEIGPEPKGTA